MTTSRDPTNTSQPRVVVVGDGPLALELAFRLRLKLGPKSNILLVPQAADPGFRTPTDDSLLRPALGHS